MAFVIEKDVPPPTSRMGGRTYPFAQMEVGDSFTASGEKAQTRVASAAGGYGRYHHKKFICRRIENGVRVWRIS